MKIVYKSAALNLNQKVQWTSVVRNWYAEIGLSMAQKSMRSKIAYKHLNS